MLAERPEHGMGSSHARAVVGPVGRCGAQVAVSLGKSR